MKHLTIFASGSGSNAQRIMEHFMGHRSTKVGLIVCNVPEAGVIDRAARFGVPVLMIEKETFFRGSAYIDELQKAKTDLVVLAGFLWKIPAKLIEAFPGKIINIHPALLPRYGGKGMYGSRVHQAVIDNGEMESGITIHFVDEHYDNGDTILQVKCPVQKNDTAETLAARINGLEHEHYPLVIEKLLKHPE